MYCRVRNICSIKYDIVEASDATTSRNGLFFNKYWQIYIGYSISADSHVRVITVRVSRPGVPHSIAPPVSREAGGREADPKMGGGSCWAVAMAKSRIA